jgi:hypothetical protein
MQLPGKFGCRHVQLLQLIRQNRAGMNGIDRAFFCFGHGSSPSVIINNFDIEWPW